MKTHRRSSRSDQPGKVFTAESNGMSRCVVCEELFSQREASEHSTVPCQPKRKENTIETSTGPTTPTISVCPVTEGSASLRELAQYYLDQGSTVRAAALMMTLVKTESTPENLTLLADIYMQQGLHDDAKALYLQVVKSKLESNS